LPDLTQKYRVESGDDVQGASTLGEAKVIAAEWQLARLDERVVFIIRQWGQPKRWKATLAEKAGECDVRLDELFDDGIPSLNAGEFRARALAAQIERQQRRRRRRQSDDERKAETEKVARSRKFGKGVVRPVVCLSTEPPRVFEGGGSEAADWLGVAHQSLFASLKAKKKGRGRRKCCRMVFAYLDELTKEEREKMR
jgi:hypothetical protein